MTFGQPPQGTTACSVTSEKSDGDQGTPPKLALLTRADDEFEFWFFLSRNNAFARGVAKRCDVDERLIRSA